MIKPVKGGYQLHSKTTGKPLGPVRKTKEEVGQKDEKRVQFFKNLKKSSGGPGSLASKVKEPDLVKQVKGAELAPKEPIESIPAQTTIRGGGKIGKKDKGTMADLPSMRSAKGRRAKVSTIKGR